MNNLFKKGKFTYGFDSSKEEYVNMLDKGIIDPMKVVRTALTNAVSIASLMVTTEALVYDKEDPNAN